MQIRISLLIFSLFILSRNMAFSQNLHEIDFAIHGIFSKLDLNRKSHLYNNKWVLLNLNFPSKTGYGFSVGLTRSITQKFKLNISGRWQKWGGTVYASYSSPPYFIDIDIRYSSISVPILFQYSLVKKPKFNWWLGAGIGADFSYNVKYIENNFYGTGPILHRVISVQTPYLILGGFVEFKPKEKKRIKYIVGFTLSDDHVFNPNRYNDFGGVFWQDVIPLHSTIFSTFIGIKL